MYSPRLASAMSVIQRRPTRRSGSAVRAGALLAAGASVMAAPPSWPWPGDDRAAPFPASHHFVGERQQDGLDLGVGLYGGPAALPAEPGLPVTAERRVRLQLVAVDADGARPDGLGHPHGPLDVAGPDGGRQAVLGVIGDRHG